MNPMDPTTHLTVQDPLAEQLALAFMRAKNVDPDSIVLRTKGQHGRSLRTDLIRVSTSRVENEDLELTCFEVRRDGMYDDLPEALFHEIGASKAIKRNEAEDRHADRARDFFLPFEQELFRLRMAMQEDIMDMSIGMGKNIRDKALASLWGLPDDIAPRRRSAMLHVLPYARRIAGDLALCADSFRFVTGYPTSVELLPSKAQAVPAGLQGTLGEADLGDCMMGATFDDGWCQVRITVRDVSLEDMADPSRRRALRQTLDILASHLLPVHLEVGFTFEVRRDEEFTVLGDPSRPGILAMNTRL